jgi:hypothetical protein
LDSFSNKNPLTLLAEFVGTGPIRVQIFFITGINLSSRLETSGLVELKQPKAGI